MPKFQERERWNETLVHFPSAGRSIQERRYWPIEAKTIDLDWIDANHDQLWAEAVHAYNNGITWWPDAEFEENHIKPEQIGRKVKHAWTVPIARYLKGKEKLPIGEPGAFQLEIWNHLGRDRFRKVSKTS